MCCWMGLGRGSTDLIPSKPISCHRARKIFTDNFFTGFWYISGIYFHFNICLLFDISTANKLEFAKNYLELIFQSQEPHLWQNWNKYISGFWSNSLQQNRIHHHLPKLSTSKRKHFLKCDIDIWHKFSVVVECWVSFWSDFQSGSRVLNRCYRPMLMYSYGMQCVSMHRNH